MKIISRWLLMILLCTLIVACGANEGPAVTETSSDAEHDHSETDSDSHAGTHGLDTSLFFEGALAKEISIQDCTLSDGTETTCYQITIAGYPANHDVGPFCPPTIESTAEEGGIWFDGNGIYDVDGAFILGLADLYNDSNWKLYDDDGNVKVTETEEAFDAAARPDVDPAYQNHCVEGRIEWLDNGEPVPTTVLIPTTPVNGARATQARGNLGITLNGVIIAAPAPVQDILRAYTIAAFDDCGGHINPFDGYHLHGARGCSEVGEVLDGETSIFAYAMDGYPIHSPLDAEAEAATELDECNGHTTDELGYHYHANPALENGVLTCFMGVTVETRGQGRGGRRGDGPAPDGGPPGRGRPDFAAAAEILGITEQELMDALGPPPPDLAGAAETLGISEEELQEALGGPPPPPEGDGPPPAEVVTEAAEAVTEETTEVVSQEVEITLLDELDGILTNYCLDIAGGNQNVDPNNGLQAHTCYSYRGDLGTDQVFDTGRFVDNVLYMPIYDVCAEAANIAAGAEIGLAVCDGNDLQSFVFSDNGTISPASATELCFTAGSESRTGRNPEHQIRDLSLEACSDELAAYQQWGSRTSLEDEISMLSGAAMATGEAITEESQTEPTEEPADEEAAAEDSTAPITFQLDAWADNWFAAYLGEELIVEDSVSITTERSFNAETATFEASYPLNLNFILKDFIENDTGLEYIGSNRQQMGDGGFIMQLTNQSTGDVVAVSDNRFVCTVIHTAPLDKSCESDPDPVAGAGACTFSDLGEPDRWMSADYDDSAWTATTIHTSAAVDPKQGYNEISWDSSAQFIWGPDLETNNTILCRMTIEAP